MTPLLELDSFESLSGKASLIQEIATEAQKETVQQVVKEQKIRVKKWW